MKAEPYMTEIIRQRIHDHIDTAKTLYDHEEIINKVVSLICRCIKNENKVLCCGNGGSAADSQHMVAEMVGRYLLNRKAFPAIALTTNTSNITAIANDLDFSDIFSRQIEALGVAGDVLILFSTSAVSPNITKSIEIAKKKKITSIGFTGPRNFLIPCDYEIHINSQDTPRIQEMHITLIHIICELIERELANV